MDVDFGGGEEENEFAELGEKEVRAVVASASSFWPFRSRPQLSHQSTAT